MQVELQASLKLCIYKVMKIAKKKLYNQPIFNQVLGDTLSFEQSLLEHRNESSPMNFHYHSHSAVIKKRSSMFVVIFLTKLN